MGRDAGRVSSEISYNFQAEILPIIVVIVVIIVYLACRHLISPILSSPHPADPTARTPSISSSSHRLFPCDESIHPSFATQFHKQGFHIFSPPKLFPLVVIIIIINGYRSDVNNNNNNTNNRNGYENIMVIGIRVIIVIEC